MPDKANASPKKPQQLKKNQKEKLMMKWICLRQRLEIGGKVKFNQRQCLLKANRSY